MIRQIRRIVRRLSIEIETGASHLDELRNDCGKPLAESDKMPDFPRRWLQLNQSTASSLCNSLRPADYA
jgi:hypothetical protein